MAQVKVTEEASGASLTSFRFNLTDGTCYELIYVGNGVKDGVLKSPTAGFMYFIPADVGWNSDQLYSGLETVPAEESELPVMHSDLTGEKMDHEQATTNVFPGMLQGGFGYGQEK